MDSLAPIVRSNPEIEISTDASTKGWGASKDGSHTEGEFDTEERNCYINVLELMAAKFGLQALCGQTSNIHVLLKMDNTSDVV